MDIPAFQTIITKGLTKVTRHQKHVHKLVEPSPKCPSVFVPGNTSELTPRGSGVVVVVRNLSGREITLESHTEVAIVTTANIVPLTQVNSKQDLGEKELVHCMSAQAEFPEGLQQGGTDPEYTLQRIDLAGIGGWDPMMQQEAQDLTCEYVEIFPQNDLDSGKTSIVKHSIKVTNPTLFIEHYRCFPLECMMK